MRKSLPLVSSLCGVALGSLGIACLAVSAQVIETSDGFYVSIASRTFRLPSSGMLGDFGTYSAEWGMLGLFCIAGAALLVVAPRIRDRLHRWVAIAGLVLSLAAAALFAQNVLL